MTASAAAPVSVVPANSVNVMEARADRADIVADQSIQTAFTTTPPPPDPPAWLQAIDRAISAFFNWLGDLVETGHGTIRLILILIAIAAVAWALWRFWPLIAERLGWRPTVVTEAAPLIEGDRVRALLAEADALAAEGRYAEAVHVLLWRSLEDIGARRPDAVAPDRTARAIAQGSALPPPIRDAFAQIARRVEISHFGGRGMDQSGWDAARDAYTAMLSSPQWHAA